eukprot:Polyplicarium_translucidae@DN2923_c2_g1_i12.p1
MTTQEPTTMTNCLPRRTWTTAERPTPTMTQQGDKHHYIERATSTDHDIDDADDQGTHHYYLDRRRPVTTMTTQEPTTMTNCLPRRTWTTAERPTPTMTPTTKEHTTATWNEDGR